MICKRCGAELPEIARYCMLCGRAVDYTPAPKRRGNGQGCAYKRGKVWEGCAPGYTYTTTDADGTVTTHRRRPRKSGFPTKKAALEWAASFRGVSAAEPPTLIELWEGYQKADFKALSANKQVGYRIARRRLESIIHRRIDSLTVDDLQAAVDAEAKTHYTAKDCRDLLSLLYQRAMASNANAGRVTQNLARFIVLPPNDSDAEAVPFTREEVAALWKLYGDGDSFAAIPLLMIYTGMMPAEVMACRVEHIDLDACEIRGAGKKTSTRKTSSVVFTEALRPLLEGLIAGRTADKLLHINKDRFYDEFYAALERAGIANGEIIRGKRKTREKTPYSCRHTYGTEAVKAGLHPEIVKQLLRHSSTAMQARYTHLAAAELHEAAKKMPLPAANGSRVAHKKGKKPQK